MNKRTGRTPELPTKYMSVVKALTGYWGTYPPSRPLEPGVTGNVVDGRLVEVGRLSQYPGFDPKVHSVHEQSAGDAITVWNTQDVHFEVVGGNLSVPGGLASGRVHLKFGAKNQATLVCHGNTYRSFTNLLAVKELMYHLLDSKEWDRQLCIVTEVLVTDKAWICFSTEKNQEADLNVGVAISPGMNVTASIKAAALQGGLSVAPSGSASAAFAIELRTRGTPLFLAIQFRRGWTHPLHSKPQFLRAAEAEAFEPPAFG